MPIAIVSIIVSLVAGGGIVTASQNSLPTSALYPVKLLVENVRTIAALDNLQKVELQTASAGKRLQEIQAMQKEGMATKAIVDETLKRYQDNLQQAQEYMADIDNAHVVPQIAAAASSLAQAVSTQQAVLNDIKAQAPLDYRTAVAENQVLALNRTNTSLERVKSIIPDFQAEGQIAVSAPEQAEGIEGPEAVSTVSSRPVTGINSGTVVMPGSNSMSAPEEDERDRSSDEGPETETESEPRKTELSAGGTQKGEDIAPPDNTHQLPAVIVESEAIKIAAQAGLAKGIKEWQTSLHWYYGNINNYVWTVSNRLSEFNGQTVVIDAFSGKVYEVTDYRIVY